MGTGALVQKSILLDFFSQVYLYREYLKQSVLRDLRIRYKRSVLGYFWTVLHPLGMMAVLSLVFSKIMRIPVQDYAVFLFPGMLAWNYFHSTTVMSLGNIRANARLFGQIPLPKYIFIVSLVTSNLINMLLAYIPLLIIMLVVGRPIGPSALFLPIALLPLVFVTIGVSLFVATSNVFYDDTLHLCEVGLQALYFMCPVLYHREMLPSWLVDVLVLNPLFYQIEFIRGLFYDAKLPDPELFLLNLTGSLVILLIGLKVFSVSEKKFLYFL
jgi:ABC-type polysaccharide/polyol phosphate export permease